MIEKTQNSKVKIFDIIEGEEKVEAEKKQKTNRSNRNKSSDNYSNRGQKNNIELTDAKLYMNAVLIIQGGADKNNQQTLVNVELKTGRKHQIRAQMAHIG